MKPDPPKLDYAHPSRGREYARTEGDDRLDAVARYNEAEFGERHPFVGGPVLRRAMYAVVLMVIVFALPRDLGEPLAWLVGIGLITWEAWIER